jgi:hypothetical protein
VHEQVSHCTDPSIDVTVKQHPLGREDFPTTDAALADCDGDRAESGGLLQGAVESVEAAPSRIDVFVGVGTARPLDLRQ